MKVSKEAIVGVLAALQRYESRDSESELNAWRQRISRLASGLGTVPWLEIQDLFPAPNGQPFPALRIGGQKMPMLLNRLRNHQPRIILAEDDRDGDVAYIFPMCLRDEEVETIIRAVTRCNLDNG